MAASGDYHASTHRLAREYSQRLGTLAGEPTGEHLALMQGATWDAPARYDYAADDVVPIFLADLIRYAEGVFAGIAT